MPLTPLHLPVAYVLYTAIKRYFPQNKNVSLPGLLVGSVFPDLEIIFAYLLSQGSVYFRTVLHSLLGATIIGTALAFLSVVFLYPPLVSSIFSIEKQKIKNHSRFSIGVAASCFLGIISHVLLDLVNHDFNTILWPLFPLLPSPISFALGGAQTASLVIHSILGVAFCFILLQYRGNLRENLLVGKNEN
ncbi:MAG: DUF4184 family protein [Candidatus Ranarchaeia archaeon]|jgi:membrane-bound metal-dependent hydrolase YbcI (DUF457 family)